MTAVDVYKPASISASLMQSVANTDRCCHAGMRCWCTSLL